MGKESGSDGEGVPQQASYSPSVWRFAMAKRAHLIVDADGYFELIREAMLKARQSIFLIGWDFDTRIHLSARRHRWKLGIGGREVEAGGKFAAEYPSRLGAFVIWLAKRRPGLRINMLKWNFAIIKTLFRGAMILDLLRWAMKDRIDFKFDSAHPVGSSHHQKIVVIDDCLAVCGGIDMTSDRWDTRAHLHEHVRRMMPSGKRYGPWHDVTMMMEGDIAVALAELGRERWKTAGGKPLAPCRAQEVTAWPDRLVAEFENVEIGIARTRAAYHDAGQINEIEELFIEHIARAKRFFYAETQYFASRKISEAIAERLDEPDPPEFIIINPRNADGWLEQQVMDSARVRLLQSLFERDHADRLRIYVPYTSGGTPIYVHAKLTIVDDEILRVGSANMNNRSMGLDSECDVFLDARRPANRGIEAKIERIRISLIAEHCGISIQDAAESLRLHGSMIAMLDAAPRDGKHIERLPIDDLADLQKQIADSAMLDPERPGDSFEPIARRSLFRTSGRLRKPLRRLRRRLA
jgi:phosphatidylserine/phosphatidylglycerophosphate/cardiolipin synthase-like enzyme